MTRPGSSQLVNIQMRGPLCLGEEEGGFCSADILIDGEPLDQRIAKTCGLPLHGRRGVMDSPAWPLCELKLRIWTDASNNDTS
jgi:hypothetical protein